MATERVLSAESLAWEISLLLTGVALLYQHVVTKPCAQCTLVALELFFTVLPLCISLAHSMLVLWMVLPVRSTAIRLFPRLGQVIFDPDLTAYVGGAVDL
ncbi:Protein T09B9.5 [Aphelenchoides avenae]|nr:Protein T09B9.5 [Aphelenchus avenae]